MNLCFEVSTQRLFLSVSINHYAFIVFISINHRFKVLAYTVNMSKSGTLEIEF